LSGFGLQLAQTAAARGDCVIAASRNPDKVKDLSGQENIKLVRLDHNEGINKIKDAIRESSPSTAPSTSL
jgi:NAD(P)-dependent dehydrogenase (short-subunit alcohol dehydrogenase family)